MYIAEIRFNPGETVKRFPITTRSDDEYEFVELFYLYIIAIRNSIILGAWFHVEICGIGKSFFHVSMSLSCGPICT